MTKQGQVLLNFNYAYDENGNCIQKSGDLYQNAYAYDHMNRLIEAVQDGKTEKYTYDLAGNRLKKESGQKTERYQYNTKNQLTGIQSGEKTIQYRYDPQGNMLEELGCTWKKHYTYDAANRQKKIELTRMSDDKSEYFHQLNCYDGEGLRYETKENGKVIRFLFDMGELSEEIREDAHICYARGYDLLSLTWNETEKNYFVPDEMGSTLFLLDKDHEIQKTYRYDAFGTILNESGDTLNRLTYTGQMYDGAMGQYYLRARFYNPSIGRFMQEDVYRGDGLNLYAYCANNPVMYFDLSGYMSLCPNGKYDPTKYDYDKIRNYRGKDISKLNPEYLANPEYTVDMPYVGKGRKNSNSQGWMRDSKYFYNELSRTHPELFDNENMNLIRKGNLPIVNEQFLDYFPQYRNYMYEELKHHHIGGGGQAMPIPESLHMGSGEVHNIEKQYNIWNGIDKNNADRLQAIKSLTKRTKLWKK